MVLEELSYLLHLCVYVGKQPYILDCLYPAMLTSFASYA